MQMYLSEKEQIFIVVQACSNMGRLAENMRKEKKLIQYDNYVQWYNMYKKFSKKLDLVYGDPTTPKRLIFEISRMDKTQLDLVEESKK